MARAHKNGAASRRVIRRDARRLVASVVSWVLVSVLAVSAGVGSDPAFAGTVSSITTPAAATLAAQTIVLSSSSGEFSAGSSATVTATTSNDVAATSSTITLTDTTTKSAVGTCTTGTTCSATISFYTGPAHAYVAMVDGLTSNTVTVGRQPWTISLAEDRTSFAAGDNVLLTATANQYPSNTNGVYSIRIFDMTTGTQLAACGNGSLSCVAYTTFYTGGPHTYIAEVSAGSPTAVYGANTDIQATSNTVSAARARWTIAMAGSSHIIGGTSANDPPMVVIDLTTTTNQYPSNTNGQYSTMIIDYTTGRVVAVCTNGSLTCAVEIVLPAAQAGHSYQAVVAPNSYATPVVLTDVQATSGGFSSNNGVGAILPGESRGGSNPAEPGCQCSHADPVNTATGEFYLPATDIGLAGVGPGLAISRTYSTSAVGSDGPFGFGWSANFMGSLNVLMPGDSVDPLPRQVQLVQENGSTVVFSEGGDHSYLPPARVQATLTFDATAKKWTFTRHNTQVLMFDASGLLLTVADGHGNTITVARNASGQVSSLTGSGGRVLTLTWSGAHVIKVTDSGSRSVSYAYDAVGNLTAVAGVDGSTARYGYDAGHYMTSVIKPGGGVTTNTYDTAFRVTAQSDPLGRVTTFGYADTGTTITKPDGSAVVETYQLGRLVKVTSGFGTALAASTTYTYDVGNNVASVTDPLGKVSTSTYDAQGHQLTTTDPLGRVSTWTYDSLGDPLTVKDPLGRTALATFDATGNRLTATSPSGRKQTWTYNTNGTTATFVDARAKTTKYVYNTVGLLVKTTDPVGRTQSVAYSAASIPVSTTDGLGKVTSVTTDPAGRVLTVTDPNLHVTTSKYDADGNRVSVTDPNQHTSTAVYDTAGQLLSSTDGNGKVTTRSYTLAGYLASVTDPNGHTTSSARNVRGELVSVTDANNRTTTTAYDLAGRKLSVTQPSGAVSSSVYDAAGQVTSSRDPNGSITSYRYDVDGELTATTDPLGKVTGRAYTPDGDVSVVTNPGGSTQKYVYDGLGHPLTFTNADAKATTYVYDASGLLASKTEPGLLKTSYTYDLAGRNITTTLPNATVTTIGYDPAGQATRVHQSATGSVDATYTYDPAGQRTGMVDATGTSTYTYDPAGRQTDETNGATAHIGYGYDAAGQMTTLTYPNGTKVGYGYDSAGQMASVTDSSGNITSFGWTANGQLATQTSPNGVAQTRGYDTAGQTTGITTMKGTATLGAFTYGYDTAGHLTADSTTGTAHAYQYDPVNQLTTVATTPTGGTTSNAGYIATAGGLLTKTTAGTVLGYNTAQELTTSTPISGGATTYTYDANGSRITAVTAASGTTPAATTQYGYTATGALASVTLPTGPVISYTSNGNNLRQSRTATGNATTPFTWATAGKLPLLLDDGTRTYIYGPSLSPIAQIDDTTWGIEYLHGDLLGSPRLISNATGAVTGATTYDPYGNRTAHTGTSDTAIGYSGNWADASTGLVYLRARDYDPATGQFLTVDPALNLTHQPYAYTGNNPLLATDPLGLWTIDNGLDWLAGSMLHGPGANITSFIVGFGDAASFGASQLARNAWSPGSDCTVAKDGFYFAGQVTGTVASTVAYGGGAASAAGRVSSAGKLFDAGEAITGAERGVAGTAKAAGRAAEAGEGGVGTFLYQKLGSEGEHLKYGITKNPATRYTAAEMNGGELNILASGAKTDMLALERSLHEWLPIGPEEGQSFYILKQIVNGLRPPPY